MPIFEYTCRQCGVASESLAFRWPEVKCRHCGSNDLERKLSSFGILIRKDSSAAGEPAQEEPESDDRKRLVFSNPGPATAEKPADAQTLGAGIPGPLFHASNAPAAGVTTDAHATPTHSPAAIDESADAGSPPVASASPELRGHSEELKTATQDRLDRLDRSVAYIQTECQALQAALEQSMRAGIRSASVEPALRDEIDQLKTGMLERLDRVDHRLADMRTDCDAVSTLAVGFEQSIAEDRAHILALQGAVDTLTARLTAVEDRLIRPPWPRKFLELQDRIRRIQQSSPARQPQWLEVPLADFTDRLRKRGFVLSERTASDIWAGLRATRVVVLQGPPGTGKTMLAKYLAEVLLPPFGTASWSFITMGREVTLDSAIGRWTTTSDDRIGPHLGFITSALATCHESQDGHWLIIDEFNRGDIDANLTPIFDALSPLTVNPVVVHPCMFPDEAEEQASIPVPESFRIIGTMNQFDHRLWDLSVSLRHRVTVVDMPPLTFDQEVNLVRASLRSPSGVIAHKAAETVTQAVCAIARDIRALSNREPKHQFVHCGLGSGMILQVVESCLQAGVGESESDEEWVLRAVDEQMARRVLPSSFADVGSGVLETLRAEIFMQASFRLSRSWLSSRIHERQAD